MDRILYQSPLIPSVFQVCGLTMYTTGCTDEELVKLKVPYVNMHNDFITDRGLNRLLRVLLPIFLFSIAILSAMEEAG